MFKISKTKKQVAMVIIPMTCRTKTVADLVRETLTKEYGLNIGLYMVNETFDHVETHTPDYDIVTKETKHHDLVIKVYHTEYAVRAYVS